MIICTGAIFVACVAIGHSLFISRFLDSYGSNNTLASD
jgi:hypothetical protein